MPDENGLAYYELGLTAPVNRDGTVSEEHAEDVREIFQSWTEGTQNGREFLARWYGNPANANKLTAAIAALGQFISVRSLDDVYGDLAAADAFEPPPPSKQETAQRRRREQEAQWSEWLAAASTAEVKAKERVDRRFSQWLEKRLKDETAPPAELPLTPEQEGFDAERARLQREQDRRYARVPSEARSFAEMYKKLSMAELRTKMRDPEFRRQVDEASAAGAL